MVVFQCIVFSDVFQHARLWLWYLRVWMSSVSVTAPGYLVLCLNVRMSGVGVTVFGYLILFFSN